MVLLINPVSLKLSSKQVIKVCSFWLLSTVMSSSELVMDGERLIHIKEVTQHHAVCSALLENLQSAHYSLLKAKQQVRQLPWMTGAIRQKLDESIKEQVDLLYMHCLPCCGNGKGWHMVEKHAG